MTMMRYTCPICEKAVLDTTHFDNNVIEILFKHLLDWHKEEFNKPKE